MKIDQIFITTCAPHEHFARCCVAGVRHWHPDIPIALLKDESLGAWSTRELERCWGVERFEGGRPLPGGAWAKLEPLFVPDRRRCLIIDSDTVFLGPLLDRLESFEADFVVESAGGGPLHGRKDWMRRDYFDLDALRELDPDYTFPGFTFNTGALLGTSGILTRADFDPWVRWERRPEHVHPGVFGEALEQGILNYVLVRKAQRGELSLERVPFMLWAFAALPQIRYRTGFRPLPAPRTDVPTLAHWAGKKHPIFLPTPNNRLLRRFERLYYTRVPRGRRVRRARAARRLGTFTYHSIRQRLRCPR